MPHSRSDRTNPGIKRPYLQLPETLEGEQSYCITIPGGLGNKKVLLDLLQVATYWFSWELSAGTEGKQAADAWRDKLNLPELKMCCCPEPTNTRINEEGIFQVSYDGGETWEDAPELDPRQSGTIAPPMPGADGDEKRCLAAQSAAQYISDQIVDQMNDGMTFAQLMQLILGVIALLLTGGTTAPVIVPLILTIVGGVLTTTVSAIQGAFDGTQLGILQCIIYCNALPNGSFDEAGWQEIKDDIMSQMDVLVASFLHDIVNAMGIVGLTNAARAGLTTGITECDCDCPASGCNTEWTATLGTILGEFGGYLRVQSVVDGGTSKITIKTPDEDTCCTLLDCRVIEPEGVSPFLFGVHINCGVPQTFENLEFSLGLGGCYNLVGTRLADTDTRDFVVEFLFDTCP